MKPFIAFTVFIISKIMKTQRMLIANTLPAWPFVIIFIFTSSSSAGILSSEAAAVGKRGQIGENKSRVECLKEGSENGVGPGQQLAGNYEGIGEGHLRTGDGGIQPVKSGGKWGYIDRSGRMVIPPQFERAGRFFEGLASVTVGSSPRP